MDTLDARLVAAWQCASNDLGFRFVTPHCSSDQNGGKLLFEGYLPDFGGPNGIVIVSFARRIKLDAINEPMSILPKEYRKYAPKQVIAALRDWGWFGAGAPPAWMDVS